MSTDLDTYLKKNGILATRAALTIGSSTPDTDAARNAPFYMRRIMVPILKLLPGMSHSVGDGAGRYLEILKFGDEETGKFSASKPKKMTGRLHEIRMAHIDNEPAQRALWDVTARVAGDVGYPANA